MEKDSSSVQEPEPVVDRLAVQGNVSFTGDIPQYVRDGLEPVQQPCCNCSCENAFNWPINLKLFRS